jgi:replicative DNA helicase
LLALNRLAQVMEKLARANFGVSRNEPDVPALRTPPHNFEAEMALLGALLANNKAFDKVAEFLRTEHFADERHGRIYEACSKLISRGTVANPVTLKNYFEQDDSLAEIGGTQPARW